MGLYKTGLEHLQSIADWFCLGQNKAVLWEDKKKKKHMEEIFKLTTYHLEIKKKLLESCATWSEVPFTGLEKQSHNKK